MFPFDDVANGKPPIAVVSVLKYSAIIYLSKRFIDNNFFVILRYVLYLPNHLNVSSNFSERDVTNYG